MRFWKVATARTTCGYAGCNVPEGEPVQVIQIGGLPLRFRCQAHAEGDVDWAQVEASKSAPYWSSTTTPTFTRVAEIKPPFDPKRAAAGERDE
jgi:hypothetical protein